MKAIIVHGGAGRAVKNLEENRLGIQTALNNGYKALINNNDAVKAVVEAVKTMEDNPIFNCGTGSALNILGEAEMDASLMFIRHAGEEPQYGAVAAIKSVRYPVLVALKVLEETDHLLLAGEGALRFARKLGFEPHNPVTEERLKQLEDYKQKGDFGYFSKLSNYLRWETVGAVALDDKGGIAVATSTGGIVGKLPGRVGDTSIIGAGTYVSPFGGASATGHGEGIMKLFLTKYATHLMSKQPAEEAVEQAIKKATDKNVKCGLIGVDIKGNIGFNFNTETMSWGYIREEEVSIF